MSRKKLHVSAVTPMRDLPNDPSYFHTSNAPKKNTKIIRTPHCQGSRPGRKGKQSQEETQSTKKLFNMILENMSTWLPISFRLIKFPLGFSFPCGFGMLFNCFRAQVGETTSWKLLRQKKSKPKFLFCFEISTKMDQCSSPCLVTKENIEWYVETCCNHL